MFVLRLSAKFRALKLIIFIIISVGFFGLGSFKAPVAFSAPVISATEDVSVAPTAPVFHAPILMYHYISSAPATTTLPGLYLNPQIFESQLQEIIEGGYQTVFMSELITDIKHSSATSTTSNKKIVLTFDDGYEDFYTNAFPLLKKYNLKGTLYVIINALDKPCYLTTDQLKEIASSGLVEIGSHTFNHPDLRKKKSADLVFEIKGSKIALERIINAPVLTFAYPFGFYNQKILEITQKAGYIGALSIIPGSSHQPNNLWLIKRLRSGSRSGDEFANWLMKN